MNMIISDEQFAALFKESIASDYKDALLFMNVNPDFSLMKFRKMLEFLCLLYKESNNHEFENDSLYEQIESLADAQIINGVNRESFHDVRILTNTGVHIDENNRHQSNDIAEQNDLLGNANKARVGILNLLEHAFLELKIGTEIPKYKNKSVGGQEKKNLWFACLNSNDFNEHFHLAEEYRELAEAYERESLDQPLFESWSASKFIFAAECYKMSFLLCTGKSITSVIESKGKGISISHDGHPPLFGYALLCLKGRVEKIDVNDARIILHALISRSFTEAYSHLGWSYYQGGEYKQAFKFLTHRKTNQNVFTFHKLGVLFSEGKACEINIDAAIDYFNKASDLGCVESMLALGKLYHKGNLVNKNDAHAQVYLQMAVARGNIEASIYLGHNYLKVTDTVLNIAEFFLETLKQKIPKTKPVPFITTTKVGRNEPCICGSEKKYKNCCGK